MKQCIKKIIEYLFGTKKNLTFKIGLASFMSSLIFIFLSDVFQENPAVYSIFYSATVVCIVLFILAIIKSTTATNFFIEAVRFLAYSGIYAISLRQIENIPTYSGFSLYFYAFLCCIGIFVCSFYTFFGHSSFVQLSPLTHFPRTHNNFLYKLPQICLWKYSPFTQTKFHKPF